MQRQTCNKQIDLIGSGCKLLVHSSKQVPEYSPEVRVGNYAQAHLIRDTNDRLLPGARDCQKVASDPSHKLLALMLVFVAHEPVRNEQRQAIHDHDSSLTRLSECFINLVGFFDRG